MAQACGLESWLFYPSQTEFIGVVCVCVFRCGNFRHLHDQNYKIQP